MKKIFLILFFASILFSGCGNAPAENCPEQGLKVKSRLVKTIPSHYDYRSNRIVQDALQYEVYLINCSDTEKSYVEMTQSWEESWEISPRNKFMWSFEKWGAGGNFPTLRDIKPHDTIPFQVILYPENKTYLKYVKDIKFGFIYVDGNQKDWFGEWMNPWDEHHWTDKEIDEFQKWNNASYRSQSEIENWKKEHGFKTGPDPRTIWEQ